jgi:hypothetical protein
MDVGFDSSATPARNAAPDTSDDWKPDQMLDLESGRQSDDISAPVLPPGQTPPMPLTSIAKLCWIAGWAGIAMICILSIVPGSERPHTGAPGQIEHMMAYALTAGALALRYPRRWLSIIVSLSALSVMLEAAQVFIPARHAQIRDIIASGGGAAVGAALAVIIARYVIARYRKPARAG